MNADDDTQRYLDRYVREIKEAEEKGTEKPAPLPAKQHRRRAAEIRARTLSLHDDPTGAAADLVEQYDEETQKFRRLTDGIARLMIKHGSDTAYVLRCHEVWDQREKEHNERLDKMVADWDPGRQKLFPN